MFTLPYFADGESFNYAFVSEMNDEVYAFGEVGDLPFYDFS